MVKIYLMCNLFQPPAQRPPRTSAFAGWFVVMAGVSNEAPSAVKRLGEKRHGNLCTFLDAARYTHGAYVGDCRFGKFLR